MTESIEIVPTLAGVAQPVVTRRSLMEIAGVSLVGTVFLGAAGCAAAASDKATFPHVDTGPVAPETVAGIAVGTLGGGTKPIYVTHPGSRDPIEHTVADTLF